VTNDTFDLLAFGPHPDDAELIAGGTLALMAERGYRVGIVDLTAGEMGTRGDTATRRAEAEKAAEILGVAHRECLDLPDAGLSDTDDQRAAVVTVIRRLRPRTVILPHWHGRHPDHGVASALIKSAAFLAGVKNYAPGGGAFKPTKLLYGSAFRDHDSRPSFVVDISAAFERKMSAIRCYGSQFDGRPEGGELFPTGRDFYEALDRRFDHYGSLIQVPYGEPFVTIEPIAVDDVVTLSGHSI